MNRRSAALRLTAAVAMTACAVLLILLAHDAWRWGRALSDGDARANVGPLAPSAWSADTSLPSSWTTSMLGISDDLAYRRAAIGAVELLRAGGSPAGTYAVEVETELARIVLTDPNHVRASRAADYLGVLLYEDHTAPQQAISPYYTPKSINGAGQVQTAEEKATDEFKTAVRLDPQNANAKANLEKMLEQPTPPQQKGQPKPGAGGDVGKSGSGARPPGFGY